MHINKFILILFLISFIFIAGCNINKQVECIKDSDCLTGGCSGQVCTTKENAANIITTCEYREEYGCLRFTSCGCVNNKCLWRENKEYTDCLNK